jgi:hypothetical protein
MSSEPKHCGEVTGDQSLQPLDFDILRLLSTGAGTFIAEQKNKKIIVKLW